MKKNKMMRLASVLLVAVLLSTCAISGTFAKYTSSTSGSDTARVAKWSFELNDVALNNQFTFNLFDTVTDINGSADDTDVANDTNKSIIAPGTAGSFTIKLENLSEVTAQYAIDYTVTNTSNIPIQFSINDGQSWANTPSDVTQTNIAMTNGTATITILWKWEFETYTKVDTATTTAPQQDTTYYTLSGTTYSVATNLTTWAEGTDYYTLNDDTTLGKTSPAPEVTVAAAITVTQVD